MKAHDPALPVLPWCPAHKRHLSLCKQAGLECTAGRRLITLAELRLCAQADGFELGAP